MPADFGEPTLPSLREGDSLVAEVIGLLEIGDDPSRLVWVSINLCRPRSYQSTASNSMLRVRSISSTAFVTPRKSGSVL